MSKYGPEFPAIDYADASGGSSAQPEVEPTTIFYHELNLNQDNIRNPEIRKFVTDRDFIPYYRSEITISGERLGLADSLHRARYANNNIDRPVESRQRAAETTYARVEAYVKQSNDDLSKLRLAFPAGEELPSPREIKSNPQIVDVIAGFILAFRKLESEDWPAWNAGFLASALEQIKERLALVSDEEAVALWDMTRLSHNERYKFWNGQLMEANRDNAIVREIKSLRASRHRTHPAPGAGQPEIVEYKGMTEQITEPEAAPGQDRPANMLPDGSMLIEGTQVEAITSQPVVRPLRQPKAKQPQAETLFAGPPAETQSNDKKADSVRGRLAMFADAGRIPQHELDRTAGREERQAPASHPDADLDELFDTGESTPYLKL